MLKNNLEWYRILREKTHIPIALHLGAPSGVMAALKAECIDYVNLGGSAQQVRKAAALAEGCGCALLDSDGRVVYWGASGLLGAFAGDVAQRDAALRRVALYAEADVVAEGLALEKGALYCAHGIGVGD